MIDGGCEEGEGASRTQKGQEKEEMKRKNDKESEGERREEEREGWGLQGTRRGAHTLGFLFLALWWIKKKAHTQTGLMESFHISVVNYHQGSFQERSSKLTEQTSHLEL